MIRAASVERSFTYPRLATIVASRIVLNAIFRVAYPLVPFAVAHFGVSTETATWLVTIQVVAGLTSPLGGWLGDRYGHRTIMIAGLLIVLIGTISVALAPSIAMIVASLGLTGLGTAIYQPCMQAYVSNHTSFAQRGRALGAVELSWSIAGIVAVPTLIAIAERTRGLHILFATLAGLVALVVLLTLMVLPNERKSAQKHASVPSVRAVVRQASFLPLLFFLWLMLCGQEVLFIAQAPWLTNRFGASPQEIGNTIFVFGLGELLGATLATAFTDHLGKIRAPLLGYTGAALVYLLLPLLAHTWGTYLPLFGLYGLLFEFAIVSSFSLASSINPAARGQVMSGSNLATQTGRATGSWIGVRLFEATNIVVNGIVATVLTVIGIIVVASSVRPQETDHRATESEVVRIL